MTNKTDKVTIRVDRPLYKIGDRLKADDPNYGQFTVERIECDLSFEIEKGGEVADLSVEWSYTGPCEDHRGRWVNGLAEDSCKPYSHTQKKRIEIEGLLHD